MTQTATKSIDPLRAFKRLLAEALVAGALGATLLAVLVLGMVLLA